MPCGSQRVDHQRQVPGELREDQHPVPRRRRGLAPAPAAGRASRSGPSSARRRSRGWQAVRRSRVSAASTSKRFALARDVDPAPSSPRAARRRRAPAPRARAAPTSASSVRAGSSFATCALGAPQDEGPHQRRQGRDQRFRADRQAEALGGRTPRCPAASASRPGTGSTARRRGSRWACRTARPGSRPAAGARPSRAASARS